MKTHLFTFLILSLFAGFAQAGGLGVFASHMDTSDLDNSVGYGAKLQLNLSEQALLDLSVAYHDGLDDELNGEAVELEVLPVEIGALFKISVADNKLYPYIGAGAGYYRLDLDDNNPTTDNDDALEDEVGWYGKLGLEFRISENFGLFAEGRYRDITGTLEGNRFTNTDEDELELDLSGITFNGGLLITW